MGNTVSRDRIGSFFRINRWLLVGLIVLGAAVYFSSRYVSQVGVLNNSAVSSRPASLSPVVVASTTLGSYSVITPNDLTVEQVPKADVPSGAFTSVSQLAGHWASESIAQGVPLVASEVFVPKSANVLASRIHPGNMAVDLPLSATAVVDGLVEPGDTVSIFATITEKNGQQATEDFLNQVKVLAVNGSMSPATTSTVGQNLTLILALPPHQVSELLFMQQKGAVEVVLDAPHARTSPPRPFNTSQWQQPIP